MPTDRAYIAIDLKSFYASVECVERGLDPLSTNLVVADTGRTEKTICLAVSPSMKAYGIGGRARLFEVVQRMKEVNYERAIKSPSHRLTKKSWNDKELQQHPDWAVDYIAAVPRMALYIQYSAQIYGIYLKYIAPEDIHVYSCDEVFMDVTNYLKMYKKTPHELAMTMIQDVLKQTGITATAGIGTNLYLSKIAMDIVAKHIPADKDGVRIAELNEMSYREQLWNHKPLTSFWRVGHGTANKLATYGIDTMGKLARMSIEHEELLYRLFGINAELLIDHAWGWEPCQIKDIKAYKPEVSSLSSGQVLSCPYTWEKARVVIHEMADTASLNLLDKRLVTDQLVLQIDYDTESLTNPAIRSKYHGEITTDHYGRQVPKPVHGSINLGKYTSLSSQIIKATLTLFDQITNKDMLFRRLNITTNHVIAEKQACCIPPAPIQYDLFTDYTVIQQQKETEEKEHTKERRMQEALLAIKKQFGKNAVLKGVNFEKGATNIERNKQIGGHKA